MANAGGTDTNTSQFFTTLAPNDAVLGYGYTLFGQLLTGVSTINQDDYRPAQVQYSSDRGRQPSRSIRSRSSRRRCRRPTPMAHSSSTRHRQSQAKRPRSPSRRPTRRTAARRRHSRSLSRLGPIAARPIPRSISSHMRVRSRRRSPRIAHCRSSCRVRTPIPTPASPSP